MEINSLNQINYFNLNDDGGNEKVDLNSDGDDEGVIVESSIKIKNFDLNFGGGDDADNPNSDSPTFQLTLLTSNPVNDESDKAKVVDVTIVCTTDEVSTHMI